MLKKIASLSILLFLFHLDNTYAQEIEEVEVVNEVKAQVLNAQTDFPMESVHVINLNKVVGTVTDQNGNFSLPASVNDTLYLTYLGFKPQKIRVTNDMFKFENTKVKLTELAFALEGVELRPYQLTGFLEIDVRNLPINSAYQYSISGLNKSYEAGGRSPGAVTKVLGAIMNPADQLRNIFGKKPKQMRKLRQMKADDNIRDLLAQKFDRETLIQLLQLEKVDIEDILNSCSYSKSFIQSANDLQILDAISNCYEEYRVIHKG